MESLFIEMLDEFSELLEPVLITECLLALDFKRHFELLCPLAK